MPGVTAGYYDRPGEALGEGAKKDFACHPVLRMRYDYQATSFQFQTGEEFQTVLENGLTGQRQELLGSIRLHSAARTSGEHNKVNQSSSPIASNDWPA